MSKDELIIKIRDFILENNPDIGITGSIEDSETITSITKELDHAGIIRFNFRTDFDHTNGEYEMICEYYSKIEKVIIFDYNAPECFEDVDDLAETLADYEERINAFENKITINN